MRADLCAASRNVAGNFARRGQNSAAEDIRRTAMGQFGCSAEALK